MWYDDTSRYFVFGLLRVWFHTCLLASKTLEFVCLFSWFHVLTSFFVLSNQNPTILRFRRRRVLNRSILLKIGKRQLWVRPMGSWNSTLQAAWYVRHAHWACLCYVPFVIWCLWITSIYTIWLLILSSSMVVDNQFHKFYGRPFTRVLYLFLMKDILW